MSAPAQLNMPRDFWTQVIDVEIPDHRSSSSARSGGDEFGGCRGGEAAVGSAKFPVILNGAGVVLSDGGIDASQAPWPSGWMPRSACGYQHNDAFPGSAPAQFVRPAGLQRLQGGRWN